MGAMISGALFLAERGHAPEALVRAGIRQLCRRRLTEVSSSNEYGREKRLESFINTMNQSDIALSPDMANQQHYELPHTFFEMILGSHRKYSCGYWEDDIYDLDCSEQRALQLTCEHADIRDGDQILELGCGWGSLTLWLARQYPASHITAISNSSSQKSYISDRAAELNLNNVEIITEDINHFLPASRFDRIVSVEMFEHLRNYGEMFQRISGWLRNEGRFFMHIFCNRDEPYLFIERGPSDWMTRHFFYGGMMPSISLPMNFQDALLLDNEWHWDGTHYERTANTWLRNLDEKKLQILPILETVYGNGNANQWFHRWRLFFIACAELFGMENGARWGVHHYRFNLAK